MDGKCYIGQTIRKNPKDRWDQHRYSVNRPKENGVLKRAMKLHGVEKFSFEVLYEVPNEDLDAREIHEIAERDTIAPKGYNLQKGGKMTSAHPSTRERLSQALRGKGVGRKHSEESKRKMSESSKGPKSYLFGVKLTDEQREKRRLESTTAKKVNQYTLDEKFIKTWLSVSQVKTELGVKDVSNTCNGVFNAQGGFKWTWYTGTEEYVKPVKVPRTDEMRRRASEYNAKNRDRINARRREIRKPGPPTPKEKQAEYTRRWKEKNREAINARRRERYKNKPRKPLTEEQKAKKREAYHRTKALKNNLESEIKDVQGSPDRAHVPDVDGAREEEGGAAPEETGA